MRSRRRMLALGLIGVIALAGVAWAVGRGIRSPAQIAADTAPPKPSLITVPVERQSLATEVVVRGTVRYGAARGVVLATSAVKPGSSIVSRPARVGNRLREGSVALSISSRPVFVLRGAAPMHRDLARGAVGPDVRQLEAALLRLGMPPGPVDGVYDAATEQAVVAWYQKSGWSPFSATDAQIEQLRVARTTAAAARDAVLQARLTAQTAARQATPAEIAQARTDAATATDTTQAARVAVDAAQTKAEGARDVAARLAAFAASSDAASKGQADIVAADAEVAAKQATLTTANDTQADAQRKLDQAPPDTPPADLETLRAALRQAVDGASVARQALDAAKAAAAAARAAASVAADQAAADARAASRDARVADAELTRAKQTLTAARRQEKLAQAKVAALTRSGDTSLQRQIVAAAESTARQAAADVARLEAKSGVQVPADEIAFFPTLPIRVDAIRAKLGDNASGSVMTVTSSQLTADSSLSINDAKLVKVGDAVTIEEQDLGIKVTGTVTRIADKPGTDKADPTRVHFEVTPKQSTTRLVGTSVRLTIAVKTTKGAVLAVPLSAVSVGAGGTSRVQVDRGGGRTEYVDVVPGLAANGLVEVRPDNPSALKPGDLVVVGASGALPRGPATTPPVASGGTTPPATNPLGGGSPGTGTTTGPQPGTSTDPGSATGPGGAPTTSTEPAPSGGAGPSTGTGTGGSTP